MTSFLRLRPPPPSTLFPYTTLFRSDPAPHPRQRGQPRSRGQPARGLRRRGAVRRSPRAGRSEEHTSELQSRGQLVCRLLLEQKKREQLATRATTRATSAPALSPASR